MRHISTLSKVQTIFNKSKKKSLQIYSLKPSFQLYNFNFENKMLRGLSFANERKVLDDNVEELLKVFRERPNGN